MDSPKFVSFLIGPENSKWQGCMFALDETGTVWRNEQGTWVIDTPGPFQ
jgi:hypothetical protein